MTLDEIEAQARAEAARIVAGVYLAHFDSPLCHASHYIGYSDNILARMDQHVIGGRGSRICYAARRQGIKVRLVAVWAGDRELERALKNRKQTPRMCPVCKAASLRRNADRMARLRHRRKLLAQVVHLLPYRAPGVA